MDIREIRQAKGLSQEQLAERCGVSVRTIQRIEAGHHGSLATLRAIAHGLDVELNTLTEANSTKAINNMRKRRSFYAHLFSFIITMPILFTVNYWFVPIFIWAWWVLLGWGLGVVSHGFSAFELLPDNDEPR